jgi:uncharacterized protein (DUF58 family)
MPPDRWLPLLGAIFLVGALFRVQFLTTLSGTLAVIIALTAWWRDHSLDSVKYARKPYYRRAFPGESVPLTIEVENDKLLPLSWLRLEDPWPHAVGPEAEDQLAPSHLPDQGFLTNVFNLRWYETKRRSYSLLFRQRGVYPVGPVRMQSGDIFGMYERSMELGRAEYLTVFPDLLPIESLKLPARDPFGDARSRRKIFEDPNQPMGVRDYRPEDGFRRVHWPATARTGEIQVKVYQPTAARVAVVCMNASTSKRHWEGVYPELLERMISVSATLVDHFIREGYQVGLISNSSLAHSDRPFNIPPGRSPRQLGRLLGALAGVTPLVMVPFEAFLIKEMSKVPYGASLLVVTAIVPPELRDTLLRLKRRGRGIRLLSVSPQPPAPIPGIPASHLQFDEDHPDLVTGPRSGRQAVGS